MDVRSRCVPYPMQRHLLFRHADALRLRSMHWAPSATPS